MDWISKIDWAAIIEAAASSTLGVISLALIVFGIVTVVLFRNEKSGKVKLMALAMCVIGAVLFLVLSQEQVSKQLQVIENLEEENAKIQERNNLIAKCELQAVSRTHSCRAYDKSGFHSSPRASCNLALTSGSGMFFADQSVRVIRENYRVISGASASAAVKPKFSTLEGVKIVTAFSGSIGCTNSSGTGRTCESTAEIQANAFPNVCVSILKELRR